MKVHREKKGQLIVAAALILIIGIIIFALLIPGEESIPVSGTPTRDQVSGLYPVNVVVMGHRDRTAFHINLHANIHVDFVSYYFEGNRNIPSGITWSGFGKLVHVTVTVTGGSLSLPAVSTFDSQVSLGATWGQVLIFELPPGNYSIVANGIDQDGFVSTASTYLLLP